MFLILVTTLACTRDRVFDEAINQSRQKKLDLVASKGEGLPYYSENLDPIWSDTAKIVSIPDLNLTDHRGHLQTTALFTAPVNVVAFFFASCPGFCGTLIRNMKKVEDTLKGQYPNARYIAITVDPTFDDVKTLARYAKDMRLGSQWHLLTGSQEVIFSLAKETFKSQAFQRVQADGKRNFVHSELFYVLDHQARLRAMINGTRLDVASNALNIAKRLVPENLARK